MLSGKCWSLREPAIYLPWSQQARARSAPNQQLGHPNGDERVYDWVWMVTVFWSWGVLGELRWCQPQVYTVYLSYLVPHYIYWTGLNIDSHTLPLVGSFKLCCAVAGAFSLATRLLAYASAVIES